MNNITIFFCIFKVQTKEQNVMLSDNKVIEIFYMADDFCIFLMKLLKNILLRKRALIESTNDELKYLRHFDCIGVHILQGFRCAPSPAYALSPFQGYFLN